MRLQSDVAWGAVIWSLLDLEIYSKVIHSHGWQVGAIGEGRSQILFTWGSPQGHRRDLVAWQVALLGVGVNHLRDHCGGSRDFCGHGLGVTHLRSVVFSWSPRPTQTNMQDTPPGMRFTRDHFGGWLSQSGVYNTFLPLASVLAVPSLPVERCLFCILY